MKVVSNTHSSERPYWFLYKWHLELDLAQKLAADAISAAVAQMKSETSSNEELPREEENTPVKGNCIIYQNRKVLFLQEFCRHKKLLIIFFSLISSFTNSKRILLIGNKLRLGLF